MFSIEVSDEISQKLARLARDLDNLEPLFDLFAPYVMGELDDQFAHERDVYGVNWDPLRPETIAAKEKGGFITKTMQRRGDLRDSAVTQSMKRSFVAGFEREYGKFHHSKTERAKGVPRRRLLPDPDRGLPQSWERELEETLQDFLKDAWNR